MILGKFLSSLDLFRAQTLYIYNVTKVIMVYKDKNLVFAIF